MNKELTEVLQKIVDEEEGTTEGFVKRVAERFAVGVLEKFEESCIYETSSAEIFDFLEKAFETS